MKRIRERTYVGKMISFLVGLLIGWVFYLFIFGIIIPEEEIPQELVALSILFSFITMIIYMIISEHNYLKRLELATTSLSNNISVYKKREHKLISKAEQIMSKFLSHESDIHKSVATSRTGSGTATLSNEEAITLTDLKVTIERYPDLKADQHTSKILQQLEESQNLILNSKLLYNEYVTYYNSAIISFPTVLFAESWKLQPLAFYADDDLDEI